MTLRLYVAAAAPSSGEAIANLRLIMADLPHELEVVDVEQAPERALHDHVLVTPTLVRIRPEPEVRIIGTLSLHERVLHALSGS